MKVAEGASPPAASPFGREHDEVQRLRALHLQPRAAPSAGGIAGIERLDHYPLMTRRFSARDERGRFISSGAPKARHAQARRDYFFEQRDTPRKRIVDHRCPVEIQAIEEER